MKSDLVKAGYDKVARDYLASRDKLGSSKYISQLLKYLPKNSDVLDLGCGAGVPVDDILIKAGHNVIGIDISSEQIKLARKNCPRGEYQARDLMDIRAHEYKVQAVVSFYTLFHLPRVKHLDILKVIASYLPKKGLLLITMGDREFEGEHELYGAKMWSSQYGTGKNSAIVRAAGYDILQDEIDTSGGERHQVILAQKND